jgi:hypothetical protein
VAAELAAAPATAAARCGAAAPAEQAMKGLAAAADPAFRGYAGPLLDPTSGRVVAIAAPAALAAAEELLAPFSAPSAPCQVLAVVLPKGARFRGYAYDVSDASAAGTCVGDQPCDVGQAHWGGHPAIEKCSEGTLVYAVFENASPSRERRARLTVYFLPPASGWPPAGPAPAGR